MDEPSDGLLGELEQLYCPPLDPALFTAIVSDFDITDQSQIQQLRDTLDTLKLSAWEQEDLPFDPSGTSGPSAPNNLDADGIISERSVSQHGTSQSRETDITSEFSSMSLGDIGSRRSNSNANRSSSSGSIGYVVGADGSITLSGASLDAKIEYLTEMFPSVDVFTIRHTLKKCGEDVDRSMDVLLNLAFFDEQPPSEDGTKVAIPKGIDGFEEGGNGDVGPKKARKRKPKNKNGKNTGLRSPTDSESPCSPQDQPNSVNKWDVGQKDVEFICSRTAPVLKKEAVSSAYHANGASLSATIRFLATSNAPKEEREIHDNPVMVAQVAELTQEFSSIPITTLAGLLQITRNSISAANELAIAMLSRPSPVPVSELIQIKATPLAPDVDFETPKRKSKAPRSIRDFESAQITAASHFVAGSEAFSKASAAYRRGKSDRLMGGAAAYYSSVGRDHLERAKREASAAADALVDSQSTSTALDLHGVSVQDAVRIASERVSEWWESLGDARYIRGGNAPARQGYRIVTGVGRHSHDGTSRLGPAVGKMLAREGWRVEVGEGVLTVVGVSRPR